MRRWPILTSVLGMQSFLSSCNSFFSFSTHHHLVLNTHHWAFIVRPRGMAAPHLTLFPLLAKDGAFKELCWILKTSLAKESWVLTTQKPGPSRHLTDLCQIRLSLLSASLRPPQIEISDCNLRHSQIAISQALRLQTYSCLLPFINPSSVDP